MEEGGTDQEAPDDGLIMSTFRTSRLEEENSELRTRMETQGWGEIEMEYYDEQLLKASCRFQSA